MYKTLASIDYSQHYKIGRPHDELASTHKNSSDIIVLGSSTTHPNLRESGKNKKRYGIHEFL